MNKIVFYVLFWFKHWNYYFTSDEIRFSLMFRTVLQNGFLDVKGPMSYKTYAFVYSVYIIKLMFLSDRKKSWNFHWIMHANKSTWTGRWTFGFKIEPWGRIEKLSYILIQKNQICKIIELLETVLLKYQMLKSNSNKYEKYQQNCQMWLVSGASTVFSLPSE